MTEKEIRRILTAKYRRCNRKAKLKRNFAGRYEEELERTLEKVELLREIIDQEKKK